MYSHIEQAIGWLLLAAILAGALVFAVRLWQRFVEQPNRMRARIEQLEMVEQTLRRKLDEADDALRQASEGERDVQPLLRPLWVISPGDERDPILSRDRAALRRARVPFIRTTAATKELVLAEVRRQRQADDLCPWVLLSSHGGEAGVLLRDGIAGPDFWREVLQGVEVVMLSACSVSTTADELAGMVAAVVWYSEDVPNEQAADFNCVFWRALLACNDVDRAFTKALKAVPQVSEYVRLRHE